MNQNKKSFAFFKCKAVFCALAVLLALCLNLKLAGCPVSASASGYMTKKDFICSLVDTIAGKRTFDGEKLKFKVYSSGKTRLGNSVIGSKQVKKYERKYKVKTSEAARLAAAVKLQLVDKAGLKKLDSKVSNAFAAIALAKAHELLYWPVSEEDVQFVMENRISDISEISDKNKREWFAKAYIYGYMKGSYVNSYDTSRMLSPSDKAKGSAIKNMLLQLTGEKERYRLSEDFQLIRTKKLPKNAELYPYILDSFPNSYYETGFSCMGKQTDGSWFLELAGMTLKERMQMNNFFLVFPREIKEFNSLEYPGEDFKQKGRQFSPEDRNDTVVDELVASSIEFYSYAFNVNYKTIDENEEWKSVMTMYLGEKAVDEYIENCKRNKTIIECDKVAADSSAVYWCDGQYNCKLYAHIRILSDIPLEKGDIADDSDKKNGYMYPVKKTYESGDIYTRLIFGDKYLKYKMGQWIDFYPNSTGSVDQYRCFCCSQTSRDIMIDYTGIYPWLVKFPFAV